MYNYVDRYIYICILHILNGMHLTFFFFFGGGGGGCLVIHMYVKYLIKYLLLSYVYTHLRRGRDINNYCDVAKGQTEEQIDRPKPFDLVM